MQLSDRTHTHSNPTGDLAWYLGDPASMDRYLLIDALLAADPALWTHSMAVMHMARTIAASSTEDRAVLDDVVDCAWFHDIGKLSIPPAILAKPAPLDPDEWSTVQRHPATAAAYLASSPLLSNAALSVRHHHERFDGSGYPDRLAGRTIPLASRIVAVADSYQAMVSHRPYRAPRTPADAMAELRRCAGTQFDPEIVDLVERIWRNP